MANTLYPHLGRQLPIRAEIRVYLDPTDPENMIQTDDDLEQDVAAMMIQVSIAYTALRHALADAGLRVRTERIYPTAVYEVPTDAEPA